MTSYTLRKILVAATAVAALAVVAIHPGHAKADGTVERSVPLDGRAAFPYDAMVANYEANKYCKDGVERRLLAHEGEHPIRNYTIVDETGEHVFTREQFSDTLVQNCVSNVLTGGPQDKDFPPLLAVPPKVPTDISKAVPGT